MQRCSAGLKQYYVDDVTNGAAPATAPHQTHRTLLGMGSTAKGGILCRTLGFINDHSTSGLGLLERGGEGRGCGTKLGKWPYSNSAVFYFISRVSILKL